MLYITWGVGVNSCPFAIGSVLAKIETAVSSCYPVVPLGTLVRPLRVL